MKKRKVIISLAGVGFIILAVVIARIFSQNENEVPKQPENGKTAVNTIAVQNGAINSTIPVTGRVVAADKVDLFAEVSGVSSYGYKPFKTGNSFPRGTVLLKIDDSELRNTLISSKSQFKSSIAQILPDVKLDFPEAYEKWQKYLVEFDIAKRIKPLPEVENEKFKLFLTGRNIYASYYSLKQTQSRLDKYIIRAPFNGTLTETYINRSSLVRVGQQLGEFISEDDFELEASVNVGDLEYFQEGTEMMFSNIQKTNSFPGKLVRVNKKVDPNSQLLKVYFSIKDSGLRSGEYLKGQLKAKSFENAVRVPASVLVEDNRVFLAKDGKAILTEVEVLNKTPNEVVIKGLEDGSKLITDKKNSAFAGSEVIEMENKSQS